MQTLSADDEDVGLLAEEREEERCGGGGRWAEGKRERMREKVHVIE